jgi:hypothetical protein
MVVSVSSRIIVLVFMNLVNHHCANGHEQDYPEQSCT